jgi:hypothetical protein
LLDAVCVEIKVNALFPLEVPPLLETVVQLEPLQYSKMLPVYCTAPALLLLQLADVLPI